MPSCADSLMLFFVHFKGSARTAPLRGPLGFTFLLEDPQTKKVNMNGDVKGVVIIYVDDYLIAAEKQACEETHEWFASTWKTNELQYATLDSPIRFLGMEIRQIAGPTGEFDGYSLDQEGYLEELLRHHGVGEKNNSLIPAAREWMSTDPSTFPSTFSNEHLKEAQSRTGELAWMCQRTRPDISYVTNVMSDEFSCGARSSTGLPEVLGVSEDREPYLIDYLHRQLLLA